MASVSRDMTIASIVVLAVGAGIVAWSRFAGSEVRVERLALVEPGRPATISAIGDERSSAVSTSARRTLVVRVNAYRPPTQGAVQVVIRAVRDDTTEKPEVGRFAVFPNTAFSSSGPEDVRSFAMPARGCPAEAQRSCTLDLEVAFAPVSGSGEGAFLSIASAEIDWR